MFDYHFNNPACIASESLTIKENDIRERYPEVLEILLRDHTTQQNIFWATANYHYLGESYAFAAPILPELITGDKGNVIMPRVQKDKEMQQARVRDMAEVFTPSWICNAQNNLIDNAWFGRENVFNTEITNPNGNSSGKLGMITGSREINHLCPNITQKKYVF